MSDEKTRAQQQFELDFEEFMRDDASRLAELYRKLPLDAPGTELDARVRALAQRELRASDEGESAPRDSEDANLTPTRLYLRHPRWLPALSAAAMLVLAAGIAWRMAPSGWTSRERASVPAAAAPAPTSAAPTSAAPTTAATTSARAEEKGRVDSAENVDRANAVRDSAVAKPSVSRPASATQPGALARAAPSEPVRSKTIADGTRAQTEPQAFPAAPPALKETERRQAEKVASAPPAMRYATPAAPHPPPITATAPAQEAAPAVAQSPRSDAVGAKQATPQDTSAAAGAALPDAAVRAAPKSAPPLRPAGVAGNVQSSIATCPMSQAGNDWRGRYPPEIPPTPLLRREVVKDLLGQAHRDAARQAYADFHARCPGDAWPPDILNQLQVQ